jgi:TPR repeat protein
MSLSSSARAEFGAAARSGPLYAFSFSLGWADQKHAADIEAPRQVLGRPARLIVELVGFVLILGLIQGLMLTRNFWLLVPLAVVTGCWVYLAVYPILIDLRDVYWLPSKVRWTVELASDGLTIAPSNRRAAFRSWDTLLSIHESDHGLLLIFNGPTLSRTIVGRPKTWLPAQIFKDTGEKNQVVRFIRERAVGVGPVAPGSVTTQRPLEVPSALREMSPVADAGASAAEQSGRAQPIADGAGREESAPPRLNSWIFRIVIYVIYVGIRVALSGNTPTTQFNNGLNYLNGSGVPKDQARAVDLIHKSADSGYVHAQNELGYLYQSGIGVVKDETEAAIWYRKAADQGYNKAQVNLAVLLLNARGGPADDSDAFQLVDRAAPSGYAVAQRILGYLYETGRGVAKDELQASSWYRKAAVQEDAEAQCDLGFLYEQGRGVGQNAAQAAYWYRRAADHGNARAQTNLGVLYERGFGIAKDDVQAAAWYRKAADQGNARAESNLGQSYAQGRGVTEDAAQAALWYQKAADQGDASAQNNLGVLFASGHGVPKDSLQAERLYRAAAEQGLAVAQNNLSALKAAARPAVKVVPHLAQWALVGEYPKQGAKVFADLSSVRVAGNIRRVWIKWQYYPRPNTSMNDILYGTAFNCLEGTNRDETIIIQNLGGERFTEEGRNSGEGAPWDIPRGASAKEWLPLPAGTPWSDAMDFVCRWQKSRKRGAG